MRYKDFEAEWLKVFAKDLTDEQRKRYITTQGQYLWHAFSFGLVPCLEGDAAKAKYNRVSKEGATEFSGVSPHENRIPDPVPLAETHMTAEQIHEEGLSEFYVIGKDNSWCYIRTHEDGCALGPFFCFASEEETELALRHLRARR